MAAGLPECRDPGGATESPSVACANELGGLPAWRPGRTPARRGRPHRRSSSIWAELKASLIDAAGDPSSELRQRLHTGIIRLGQALQHDQALAAKVDGWAERAVVYLVDHYREEIAHLVSGTIERWDADDTSRRIEEQVGRDLQFIRINGTVVGALAGLGIHIFSRLLG